MKKVIKKSIALIIMFTTLLGYANESKVMTSKKEYKKTSLTLNGVKEGQKLVIKDQNGLTLYKELIKESGTYYKGFDLTSLPDGKYYFELDKDFEIKTIPFKVKSNSVVFEKEEEVSVFKPIIRVKDNRILISKLSLELKPTEIKFYEMTSEGAKLVHSESIENTKIIERIYRIAEKYKSTYKIVIKSEGREFVEYINI
ncbi:hypothetical protein RXV94_00280 [Yeosuana sp. MJ-SS3]|uniref:Uncharacterized protein n=1 Tax=Gilvirhabdus luticola TaxID=3079858 RepID=A0ABU3U2E2_9FLAO|nr:hypothetical protein [Yeosuana sp. MJ-SS3]MDU8884574.1 hypothetical protein [Yeosuana sp. MJ-SS3]